MKQKYNKKGVLVVCPNPSVDIYAQVDGFNIGTTTRIKKEARYPGGKGVHVAMALAELGVDVTLLGFWGGVTGDWIKEEIKNHYPSIVVEGISIKEWSRSCYTFKSKGKDNDSELLGTGPQLTGQDYDGFFDLAIEQMSKTDFVVLSGSWPMGAPSDGYARLIEFANSMNLKTFLDCTGEQLTNALKLNPFLIHLNKHEVMEVTKSEDFETARKQISGLVENSAITNGSKGLYYNEEGAEVHSLYTVEKVISTVGSGDCLLAGIVTGHLRGASAKEIANLGAACGAANCLREELGMFYKADVLKLLSLSSF